MKRFLGYAGIVIALTPTLIPVIYRFARLASIWFHSLDRSNSPEPLLVQNDVVDQQTGRSAVDHALLDCTPFIERAITISFPKSYLLSKDGEETAGFKKDLQRFFSRILKSHSKFVYIIMKIDPNTDDELRVQQVLKNLNLINQEFSIERVVFCETDIGKIHIIRHIHPDVHIDYSIEASKKLLPHLLRVYLVAYGNMPSGVVPPGTSLDPASATPAKTYKDSLPGLSIVQSLSDVSF